MTINTGNIGKVRTTAIARDILFEEGREGRLKLPHADRWIQISLFNKDWTLLELDVGSVMGFDMMWEAGMTDHISATLNDIGSICKGDWVWYSDERTIHEKMMAGHLANDQTIPNADTLVSVPVDHRKFLIFNFASRDDAMLARMTIIGLRSVKNVDSGGLPQTP